MKAFASYEARLARGCAAGHLTVETAVKALIHLSSSPKSQPWSHEIAVLLGQLDEPHESEIATRLDQVGISQLQKWQQQARYEQFVRPSPEVFTEITEAACSVALYTADQFPPGQDMATDVWRNVSDIDEALARRDLYTGRDRDEREALVCHSICSVFPECLREPVARTSASTRCGPLCLSRDMSQTAVVPAGRSVAGLVALFLLLGV